MADQFSAMQLAAISQYLNQSNLLQNNCFAGPNGYMLPPNGSMLPPNSTPPLNYEYQNVVSDDDNDEDDTDLRTLYCGNLDEKVTEELLYEVFLQAGPIDKVNIPKEANGKNRTFGFVVFTHACSVAYALQLYNGLRLFGRNVLIKNKNTTGNKSIPQRRSLPDNIKFGQPAETNMNVLANAFTQPFMERDRSYSSLVDAYEGPSRYDRNSRHNTRPYDRPQEHYRDRYSDRQQDQHSNRSRNHRDHRSHDRHRYSDPPNSRRY